MAQSADVTPESAEVTLPELDDLGNMMLGRINEWADQATNDKAVIAAADPDKVGGLVITFRDSHDSYPEYQSLIEKAEALLAQIDRDNMPRVKQPSEAELEAAKASLESVTTQAKAGIKMLVAAYGPDAAGYAPEAFKSARGAKSGQGTGAKRPRLLTISVAQMDDNEILLNLPDGEIKATFSNTAKWISENLPNVKVETAQLQDAAFEVAGTKDLATVSGKSFEFQVPGDKGHKVVFIPRGSDK